MDPNVFDETMRSFIRREPFEPFVIELTDGREILVERPKMSFGGGSAAFLTPEFDLVEFDCTLTVRFRPAVTGATR